MSECRGKAARRASVASWLVSLALALGSCATAHEATMPDDDTPNFDAGGASVTAGASAMTSAGRPSSAAGANAAAGAPSTSANIAGAPSSTSGAGGTSNAGSHSGGSSGSTNGSAGNHAGGGSSGSASSGGSPGIGTVLFSDDFEDGAANGWTASAGTWAVTTDDSKVYAQTATGTGSSVLSSAPASAAWSDQIIEAKIKINTFGGSSTSYFAAIYGRFDGSGYYSLALRSDGKIAIRKNTTTLGSAVAAGIAEGTWYTVRLEIVGSTLKAYVNGALKDTETDTSLDAGGVALAAVNTTAEFDDVKVSRP